MRGVLRIFDDRGEAFINFAPALFQTDITQFQKIEVTFDSRGGCFLMIEVWGFITNHFEARGHFLSLSLTPFYFRGVVFSLFRWGFLRLIRFFINQSQIFIFSASLLSSNFQKSTPYHFTKINPTFLPKSRPPLKLKINPSNFSESTF